jgi:hypothetical protein
MRYFIFLFASIVFTHVAVASPIPQAGTRAAYGSHYLQVAGCWGMSYRLNGEYYHQVALERTFYKTTCTQRSFTGYGVNATFFGNGNYSFGAKYYKAIMRLSSHMLNPYWGIAPSWFTFEGASGINVKPLLGFKFSPLYGDAVSLDVDLFYGYDIPVIHEREFTPGRHDFTALLSLTFNINRITYLLSRSDVEKERSRD